MYQNLQFLPHPVNDVLKTTSPTWVPEAPNDFAFQIEPSSSTSLASEFFQGLSPLPMFHADKTQRQSQKENIYIKGEKQSQFFHVVTKCYRRGNENKT